MRQQRQAKRSVFPCVYCGSKETEVQTNKDPVKKFAKTTYYCFDCKQTYTLYPTVPKQAKRKK